MWYFARWRTCVHDLLNSAAITEMLCHARSSRSRGFCRNIDPFPACTLNIRSTSVCRSIVYLEMTPSSESILLSEERCCCGTAYWTKNNAFYKVTSRIAAKHELLAGEHGKRVTALRSRTDCIHWAWRPLAARAHLFSVRRELVILLFQTQSFRRAAPFANYPPDVQQDRAAPSPCPGCLIITCPEVPLPVRRSGSLIALLSPRSYLPPSPEGSK